MILIRNVRFVRLLQHHKKTAKHTVKIDLMENLQENFRPDKAWVCIRKMERILLENFFKIMLFIIAHMSRFANHFISFYINFSFGNPAFFQETGRPVLSGLLFARVIFKGRGGK